MPLPESIRYCFLLHPRALLLYAPRMSNVAALYDAPDTPSALTCPLSLALVAAGSSSPADDHLDRDLDLHELLIQHPTSTFYIRPPGDSMQGVGLYDSDILVVDRSLEPKHHDIVIAVLNGELTVKRLFRQGTLVQLRPANPRYPIVTITPDEELLIWSLVTGSIRLAKARTRVVESVI
jgi:DNA polymerase V